MSDQDAPREPGDETLGAEATPATTPVEAPEQHDAPSAPLDVPEVAESTEPSGGTERADVAGLAAGDEPV
ncbi:MAG: hypothetical protein JWP95_605, partial [Actinotalea sp.]|nr:hypothetical protein [Actinotalea sp.]